MKYEYLIFNLLILSLSSLSVLIYPGGRFPDLKRFGLAWVGVIIPYLVWDYLVTDNWWTFNSRYLTGIKFGRLPMEEILFFIIVPWSCLIIWENLRTKVKKNGVLSFAAEPFLVVVGLFGSGVALVYSWPYTLAVSVAFILVAVLSWYTHKWFSSRIAWGFLALVTCLILVFNGYLTARPVVVYNPVVKSGIKIGTIPVEDVIYGLILISAVVIFYEIKNAKSNIG